MMMPQRVRDLPGPLAFTCNETFEAVVNGRLNVYLSGNSANGGLITYQIQPSAMFQDLYEQAIKWAEEGRINFVLPNGSQVSGNLEVI